MSTVHRLLIGVDIISDSISGEETGSKKEELEYA